MYDGEHLTVSKVTLFYRPFAFKRGTASPVEPEHHVRGILPARVGLLPYFVLQSYTQFDISRSCIEREKHEAGYGTTTW